MASVAWGLDPGPIAPIAGAGLILSGAACLALELRSWRVVALVIALSTLAELTGLFSGYPFGSYEYTDQWWPTIALGGGFRFPLLLPFAWVLIMAGAFLTVRTWTSKWRAVGLSAIFAAAIDAPMERAMTDVLGYWRWTPPGPIFGAPVMNSVGWLLVASAVGAILSTTRPLASPSRGPWVLALFCMFVAVSGLLRFYDPAWIILLGLAVLLAGVGARQRSRAVDLKGDAVDTV